MRCYRHSFANFSTKCHALFAKRMILNERRGIKLSVYCFLFRVLVNEHAVIRFPRKPVQYGGFCQGHPTRKIGKKLRMQFSAFL